MLLVHGTLMHQTLQELIFIQSDYVSRKGN